VGEAVVLRTRNGKFALVAWCLTLFGGCQYVGPIAIDQGRDRYNHTIESTSKEQTFANILRVYHHEPTLFMDVTEVDASTTLSGAATGGAANIGARAGTSGGTLAGQTEAVAGGVTYSESPLIRYQPLLGQALVVQLATPVSTDALAALHDSNWDVAPLLDFSTSFLTLDYDEFYGALNIITELADRARLELVAEKSDLSKTKDATKTGDIGSSGKVTLEVTNKSSTGGTTDSLVIYFLPFHPHAIHSEEPEAKTEQKLWNKLRNVLYASTQGIPPKDADCTSGNKANKSKDSDNCFAIDLNRIELRTMPVTPATRLKYKLDSGAPLMKTYSALGILKSATEETERKIAFVPPDEYQTIRSYDWNNSQIVKQQTGAPTLTFYTLRPRDDRGDAPAEQKINKEVYDWLLRTNNPIIYKKNTAVSDDFIKGNRTMGLLRRYILVIKSDIPPPADAYVAHFDQGEWYYIDAKDDISQKNFDLISLFMTMMAVPSGTPPLAPSISVGGGM
jgi:hypothetical protein